jgi:hypothetical protein
VLYRVAIDTDVMIVCGFSSSPSIGDSLEHLDETMTKLAVKIRRLEMEIAVGVRKQSHTAVKGRVSLQRAKSSMLVGVHTASLWV